jgi:hypothetical protein
MGWRARIWLLFAAAFWLVMMTLLWRATFGVQRQLVSSIPPEVVWKKMLTAPDHSTLEIRYGTNVAGTCRWRPELGQETATGARMLEESDPIEGMVPQLAYYTLDFDGTVTLPDFPTRISFSAGLTLDTNFTWQKFEMKINLRPDLYEVIANAVDQSVLVRIDAGGDRFNRKFRFSDFQNPQKLLQEFGGPMLPAMVGAMGVPLSTNKLSAAALGLHWEARNDSIIVGRNRVRAYRLQTKLLDRYRIALFVSPVGEILRAELSENIVLVNHHLAGLPNASDHD